MKPGFLTTAVAQEVIAGIPPAEEKLSSVILDNEILRVVHVMLPAGKELEEHAVPGPVVVQVVEGTVDFQVNNTVQPMSVGDVIYMRPQELHAVRATAALARISITQIKAVISDETDESAGGCGCGGHGKASRCGSRTNDDSAMPAGRENLLANSGGCGCR